MRRRAHVQMEAGLLAIGCGLVRIGKWTSSWVPEGQDKDSGCVKVGKQVNGPQRSGHGVVVGG